MTVWFDVEDLLHHRRQGSVHPTGIQRLTLEIYRAADAIGGVGFVCHGAGAHRYDVIDWRDLSRLFEAPETAAAAAPSAIMAAAAPRRAAKPRHALFTAGVMQAQTLLHLGEFGAGIAVHTAQSVRRRSTRPRPAAGLPLARARFEAVARPGDTLLVLGSPWIHAGYSRIARWLRDDLRVRFGVLMHDLTPVRHPEWCDEGVRRTFRTWYADVLPFCDLVLANSRYTAADVERYARELGVVLPRPVRAVPIGAGHGPHAGAMPDDAAPGNYVLFVSTLEARKNHALMALIWRGLLDEVRTGQRAADSVPDLVFAGRIGWLVADLVEQLDNTGWLRGRIRRVSPNDAELRRLYCGALFTVFPSFFEGWGLPVTESLSLGVPCLSSNAASLPEAGGALCRYFDPENGTAAYAAVAALLDDRPGLAAWRAQVRREFRPTPWSATAQAVLDEAHAA